MEINEIVKRIEWLDTERRKDKQLIIDLTNQIEDLTKKLSEQQTSMKGLETSLKKSSQSTTKVEEVEEKIATQKVEFVEQLSSVERKISIFEKKFDKLRKDDADSITKKLIEFQNELKPMGEFRKTIQDRADNEYRVNQKIEENSRQVSSLLQAVEETKRLVSMLDDSQKLESNRISDLQVEMNILRKRIEEVRNLGDVQTERASKIETRINDLENQEQLRKQEQVSFIESQSRSTVDLENKWKDWELKFKFLDELSQNLKQQMLEINATHRAMKQSLTDFEEINLKLDRRINEITEINRLSEDRFRQEWVSFKADDQKRWTNYALTQEEQNRERDRELSRVTDLIAKIEENVQRLLDSVSVINEETEKRIKAFLALSNDLMTSFEKSSGKRN